jgi:DNA-binding response OmpR family regulator
MVITDMKMETDTAGYDVLRAAKRQKYSPATAILTAFPTMVNGEADLKAESLLVKPVGTEHLLRQIEVLLIQHEDKKHAAETSGREGQAAQRKRAV